MDNGKLSSMFAFAWNKLKLVSVLDLNYGLRVFAIGESSSIDSQVEIPKRRATSFQVNSNNDVHSGQFDT